MQFGGVASVLLLCALFFLVCAQGRPQTAAQKAPVDLQAPDDWYYCGKDPSKPTPNVPPLVTSRNLSLLQGNLSRYMLFS